MSSIVRARLAKLIVRVRAHTARSPYVSIALSHTCIVQAWVLDVVYGTKCICNKAVAIESYLMSLMMQPYLSLKANARYLWAKYLSPSLAFCLLPDFHHDWWQICSRESHFKSVYKINFTLSSYLHLQNIYWFEWGSEVKFHRWWSSLNKSRRRWASTLLSNWRNKRVTKNIQSVRCSGISVLAMWQQLVPRCI